MLLAGVERKPILSPLNAISHIIFGDRALDENHQSGLKVLLGLMLNAMAMVGWAAVAELGFRSFSLAPHDYKTVIPIAIVVTVLAYYVDFFVVPKRFTPGFERILSWKSLGVVYAFLAMSFVFGGMQRIA